MTAVVTTLVVAWGTSRMAPIYEATTRLRIVPYSLGAPDYGSYVYFDRLASTYSDIVHSETVIEQAEQALNLEELPEFDIQVIPQTELMRLTVTDTDPAQAQIVANTLADLLIQNNQNSHVDIIQERLAGRLEELEVEIDQLTIQYARLSGQFPRDEAVITEVRRTLDSLQENYSFLLNNANQALISDIARASALTVAESARLPAEPVGPSLTRNVIVAAVTGLAAGFILAFVLENRRPRLYTTQQIEKLAGSRVIAHVPFIRRPFRDDVFPHDRVAAEAFRRLRTHLFGQNHGAPLRFLLVTSAVPGEGKSTVAINLALAIARSGRSVLLIDANLQCPTLHDRFRVSNLVGLGPVLAGKADIAKAVQGTDVPNLFILTAGPINEQSSELLSSDRFLKVLDEAVERADAIIIDAAPVLSSSDSLIIARQMSGVLWVVDPNIVDLNTFDYAQDQMEQVGVPVTGLVVNRDRSDKTSEWVHRYRPSANNTVTVKTLDSGETRTERVKL
ncbi:MAG: polysaccharide biosynthesis tyrosine autokinase [Chloroflexi bacterium]|nr:polysaccharide biosynthesis tyrosine autokinase [Chloroflexota bacterium]